jgi:hypothetical protein
MIYNILSRIFTILFLREPFWSITIYTFFVFHRPFMRFFMFISFSFVIISFCLVIHLYNKKTTYLNNIYMTGGRLPTSFLNSDSLSSINFSTVIPSGILVPFLYSLSLAVVFIDPLKIFELLIST